MPRWLRLVAIYVPLTVFAVATLIPFAYLTISAFKDQSVMFDAPFLPTNGLFKIDPQTGTLTVVDVSHLPGDGDDGVYTLDLTMKVNGDETDNATVFVLTGDATPPADAPAEAVLRIPADAAMNTEVGAAYFPAFSDARLAEQESRKQYDARVAAAESAGESFDEPYEATAVTVEISDGNPRGRFGVAWSLLSTDSFVRLTQTAGIWINILNSFFYASVLAVLATLCSAMGGYGLAKYRFRGEGLITNIVLVSLIVPGALLLAPGYRVLFELGLLDSYNGLIIPAAAPAFGVYLFRQSFISSLPNEMIEAARIDGCGEVKLFFLVGLPMVRPMIGAFMLITFLGAWNNYIGPQIVLSTPEKYPLAVAVAQLKSVYNNDWPLIMAGTLVSVLPVLVLFLLLQKEFIQGLTSGAVKG